MTPVGPHLTAFLREYIPSQREMSVQTSDTYAYAFQLLVCFAAERLKSTPSALSIEQLDPTLVLAFLEHLETKRGNCARTRNSRLAAIKTFFRFLEYRLPSCLEQARRIRAIPVKKTDEVIIGYLNREEIQALLDAPDPNCRSGVAGPRNASSSLRRGPACLRVGRAELSRSGLPPSTHRSRDGQRSSREGASFVEGDSDRPSRLA